MATALANSPHGQQHDGLDPKDKLSMRNMLSNGEDASRGDPPDITPFQKMLSATTGSLLTGLTSKQSFLFIAPRAAKANRGQ